VIEEMFRLVIKARRAFLLWITPGDRRQQSEESERFLEALGELQCYHEEKALWVDDLTKQKPDVFLEETRGFMAKAADLTMIDLLFEHNYVDPST
jgi:hypothetical protein